MIDIFVELGRRLDAGVPHEVAQRAFDENNWFLHSDIDYAIEAIRNEMLSPQKIATWIARYPNIETISPKRVLIVMAGNIPLVGLFDLLCVAMAGHTALIKYSHKDRVLMEWVVATLRDIEPEIPIYNYEEGDSTDLVIATGGDAAIEYFRERFHNTPTLLRGSRHSIAVLGEGDIERVAEDLSEDIYRYSGLGCRNVSLIFIPKGSSLPDIVPPHLNPKYRNNYTQNRALLTLTKTPFVDNGHSCIIYQESLPSQISTISLVEYETIQEVEQWIERNDSLLQCIVASASTISHPRRVEFGEAQHPSLYDYADGVDTMNFLTQTID